MFNAPRHRNNLKRLDTEPLVRENKEIQMTKKGACMGREEDGLVFKGFTLNTRTILTVFH